ncbi:MAG: low molecular weight protein arginine phosphatase [Gemmatimonas sp.]|jgi:protein-tyrosine-phosphatase|uniref:low molecular weight protein arginine phosphatase n=1 Tax=Gemmatimonas sp. TaxID=1962908 RepID=UPI00391F4414|nr:low molecular weight protein arginine phosphatase [Gemmatimonadota bacterium]
MHLLFVCTGNTCRSPLAEVIARRQIAERQLPDVTVGSAGTSAWPDAPASDGALLVALEHGMDLGEHRARVLSPELVAGADVVLAMGPHHLDRAEALGGAGRVWMLTAFAGGAARPISDPFGGDLTVYRATYVELEREISAVLDKVAADRARRSA